MKTNAIPLQELLRRGLLVFGMSLLALPAAFADDDVEIDIDDDEITVDLEDGKAEIEADGEVDVEGERGAQALRIARATLNEREAAEFQDALTEGYVIPEDYYVFTDPVPDLYRERLPQAGPNVVYRTYNGTIYAVNPTTYKVVDIIKEDAAGNTIEVATTVPESDLDRVRGQLAEGEVISSDTYVYLDQVPDRYVAQLPPNPDGTIYRYLDGTVYAVNPRNYRVVDVINLSDTASPE